MCSLFVIRIAHLTLSVYRLTLFPIDPELGFEADGPEDITGDRNCAFCCLFRWSRLLSRRVLKSITWLIFYCTKDYRVRQIFFMIGIGCELIYGPKLNLRKVSNLSLKRLNLLNHM